MSNTYLKIPQKKLKTIVKKAKNCQEEIIGILFGENYKHGRKVVVYDFLTNILHSNSRFRSDPEEFYEKISKAEKQDLDLVGFFHSHPTVPHPSRIDLKFMELWPDAYWLIIDSKTGKYSTWQHREKKIRTVTFKGKEQEN